VKDFAKKHPINKPKRKKVKASLRAKRQLNQPLKIKHLFFISSFTALVLFSSYYLLKTDVKNLRGGVVNPKIEFLYPSDLERDTILIELEGIIKAEDCEYFLQIESYGRRIYAQEQLSSILTFDLEAYVEKTFSSSQPDKPLFRVMSGPYKTKSEVNNAREILIKNDRQPFILKKCTKT